MAKKITNDIEQNSTPINQQQEDKPLKIEMVEKITNEDKALLDLVKSKKEVALANAKAALLQKEVADLTYQNFILQFALKYNLSDGDVIDPEDGSIKRKKLNEI